MKMRICRSINYILAAGSLLKASALPVDTQEAQCVSSQSTKVMAMYSSLVPRQEWNPTPATGTRIPKPTIICDPPQPSSFVSAASSSYADVPTANTTPQAQAQDEGAYSPKREHFGSRSILVVFGVIGVVVLVVIVWAIIAHRNGRRPLACFGGCGGRSNDVEAARSGSKASDIPLFGAGRHYDRRPVSMQSQPYLMPEPQRPKPVQHNIPRRPLAEPEWARHF